MIRFGPDELARRIYYSDPCRVVELRNELPNLLAETGLTNVEAGILSLRLLDQVAAAIVGFIDADLSHGLTPTFRRGHDGHILFGIGFTNTSIHPEPQRIRNRIVHRSEIQSSMRKLSPHAFEHLCAFILRRFGTKAYVTRGTQEEGIDLYGVSTIVPAANVGSGSRPAFRLIGQAKNWEEVPDPEVHKFNSQYRYFKRGRGRGVEAVPSWFVQLRLPIVAAFFSTGSFSSKAQKLAGDLGIVTVDGPQLAEDVCWHCDEWFEENENQAVFRTENFAHYFENLAQPA